MTAHRPEEFKGPCQLERLLEVPVQFILIEDLIKEKIALAASDNIESSSLGSPNFPEIQEDSENPECSDKLLPVKRSCLFNCCANPSRWKATDLVSNTSQCQTKSIKLPWNDATAVIPVLQIGKSSSCHDVSATEDTDTEVDMTNKQSNEEKAGEEIDEARMKEPVALPSTIKDTDIPDKEPRREEVEENCELESSKENQDSNSRDGHGDKASSTTLSQKCSTPATIPTTVDTFSESGAQLGKVTEKPTRYEDFLNAHCSDTSNHSRTDKDQENATEILGNKVIADDSRDDTLKLTFYKEGRKETTKEFRTTRSDSELTTPPPLSPSSLDVRMLQNQLGLQMTRIVREPGSDENPKSKQMEGPADEESQPTNEGQPLNENTSANSTKVNHSSTSGGGVVDILLSPSRIFTPARQLRLSSIEKAGGTCTPSNSISGNDGRASLPQQQRKPREGLEISRCQKDVTMLDGESSNSSISNRGITGESSHTTSTKLSNSYDSVAMGESENSLEAHLQSYLTSLRYVKPKDSGSNDKAVDNAAESKSSKGKSPCISPRQGPSSNNNIISPVISPCIRSPAVSGVVGSGSGTVISPGGVRMPTVQRVSPSQQHQTSLLDSWAERTIARIPTRPVLKKTYDQQIVVPPPVPFHQTIQQQQCLISPTAQTCNTSGNTTTFPLNSPPKRFKSNPNPIPNQQPSTQQHPFQQHGLIAGNKQAHTSPAPYNRQANTSHISQNQAQYQHQISHCANPTKTSNTTQQTHQVYNHHNYNNRVSMPQQGTSNSSNTQMTSQLAHPSAMNQSSQNYSQNYHHAHEPQAQQQQPQYQPQNRTQSSSSTPQAHYHQQQLQFHRHLQESLLIASTALSSSNDPVDSSYENRLRRYSEYYQRQELDISKLQEYHKKYGFYPWDILTARDESILRYMKTNNEQSRQEHQQYPGNQDTQVMVGGSTGYRSSSNIDERYNMPHHVLNQSSQYNPRHANNTMQSQNRVISDFTPSPQSTLSHLPTVIPGNNAHTGGNIITNKTMSSLSQTSATRPVNHNRYPVNSQEVQQHREYIAQQQQRINSKVFQEQTEYQFYRHAQQQPQQSHLQAREANCSNVMSTFDTIHGGQYHRSACQLPTGPNQVQTMGSITTGVPLHQSRPNDSRTSSNAIAPGRERMTHILHSQSGSGSRPIVMTVSDPVPAPPEAVPLSIHRQALEQAIKSNHTSPNSQFIHDPYGLTSLINNDMAFRRDQRKSPISANPQLSMHHVGQGRPTAHQSVSKEPLTIASSPILAQQTSVIRRIQNTQHEPAVVSTTSGTSNHPRSMTDRSSVPFRRISEGHSADTTGSGKHSQLSTFPYNRASKEASAVLSPTQAQFQQQQQYYSYHNANTNSSHGITTGTAIRQADNSQGYLPRGPHKRRIIITDNNGVNQNIPDRCSGVVTSPIPLIASEKELITANVSPSSVLANMNENLLGSDEDRGDALGGSGWQYDHVVLLDKRIRTYMCKRCFETLKTEQQIRNHLFCKMLANHVQCHVCQQLVNSEVYPSHLQIHGVRPPEGLEIGDEYQ